MGSSTTFFGALLVQEHLFVLKSALNYKLIINKTFCTSKGRLPFDKFGPPYCMRSKQMDVINGDYTQIQNGTFVGEIIDLIGFSLKIKLVNKL
jgi:hypothetical protein